MRYDHNREAVKGAEAHHAAVAQPFGGGSGGGVSITPIAFLVVGTHGVRVVPLDSQTHLMDRVIDSAPQVVEKIQAMFKRNATGTIDDASILINQPGVNYV